MFYYTYTETDLYMLDSAANKIVTSVVLVLANFWLRSGMKAIHFWAVL